MTDNLAVEKNLWQAADKLRNNRHAAEYKHVVLGFLFLKYSSGAFDERYAQLKATGKVNALDEAIKLNLAKIGYAR